MSNFIVVYLILISACFADSANILGVFYIPSFSHNQLFSTLMKELVQRGHNVTVVSSFPPSEPIENYRHIDLTGFVDLKSRKEETHYEGVVNINYFRLEMNLQHILTMITEKVFEMKNVQALINPKEKFDLVIIEDEGSYSFKGFAYYFNAPCIIFDVHGATRWVNNQVGNPTFPSYIPVVHLPYGSNMSFFERLHNTFVYLFVQIYEELYFFPQHNRLLQKYFPGAPHIKDLHYNVSLALVNSHVTTNQPVPLVPNMIDIGGLHIQPVKELPKDLKTFLDNAKEGVVLFSMGSAITSKMMSEEKRNCILGVLGKLKEKVLMKWDSEVENKPPNLKIESWLPINDILAHPNVKLFITHAGIFSTLETIHHGVPIVGLPFASDQSVNLENAKSVGLGLGTSYFEMTESQFSSDIQEVLTNPMYRENTQRLSKILHDQPLKPLDKAVFWVEYVIRHRGAPHLRVASLNLSWYQYLLLDVALFVLVTVLVVVLFMYILIKKFVFRVFRKQSHSKISEKKKIN